MSGVRLTGPVDVCVAVPKLSLDRPFTYVLPDDADAGVGSLVSVPFHGRTVAGWVLGPAAEMPSGRLLRVRTVRSAIRFFDEGMLELLRWASERYLAPLATVIERSHPPRVASEEEPTLEQVSTDRVGAAGDLPGSVTWLRPLPGEEGSACVEGVRACLATGARALVLLPEAEPLPATARDVLEAFADRSVAFVGGDARDRYRTWLEIRAGHHDVVVGTRPAVFAPLPRLGLVWISREVHPGHREDRSPYYHVREVAMARARTHGAACVLASLSPSVETAASVAGGEIAGHRAPRLIERRAAPLVETTAPEAEDRSGRLSALLRTARSGALILSRRGSGVARVCRACRRPAACPECRGPILVRRGVTACGVCGAPGRCAACGGSSFGIERGGTERIAEWAARRARAPVALAREPSGGSEPGAGDDRALPGTDRILVGTAATVKDVGPLRLDLVAILDPDRALAGAGLHRAEQALATWTEAAAWAGPKAGGGRVLLQTRHSGDPAVQALVRWEPMPFLLAEGTRRAEAGFPANHPVFRVEGPSREPLEEALKGLGPVAMLVSAGERGTVCLVTVRPDQLAPLRAMVLRLVASGAVTRVEAEPQL